MPGKQPSEQHAARNLQKRFYPHFNREKIMNTELHARLMAGLRDGSLVPYLGPGVLADVKNIATGERIPADSNSLILAMNSGRPMSPKLMYEFPRAAMNVELKRGRSAVEKFLTKTYGDTRWSWSRAHHWLKSIRPNYVIDINRDTQLQDAYADIPHTLIVGVARIGGTQFRYKLFHWDGQQYSPVEAVDTQHPVLFKPMGTPRPQPLYIASDADYVDYITELMGGFAIPPGIKEYRKNKQYLLLGLRLNRDTERMVLSDMIYSAHEQAGWALIPEPTDKEKRFCAKLGLEIIQADLNEFLDADTAVQGAALAEAAL